MTDALTREKIEELRCLLAKATPGPWRALTGANHALAIHNRLPDEPGVHFAKLICVPAESKEGIEIDEEDRALITAAVNALPALLDLATASLAGASAGVDELCRRLEAKGAHGQLYNDDGPEGAAIIRAQAREIEALHERLEANHYFVGNAETGTLERVEGKPGTMPDGIACRDETIRQLEARNLSLVESVDYERARAEAAETRAAALEDDLGVAIAIIDHIETYHPNAVDAARATLDKPYE